jgi:lysozyme
MSIESSQIETDEGRVMKSYVDTEGHLTGGVGHLLTNEEKALYPEGTPIPEDVVNEWYRIDLKEAEADADKFYKTDDPNLRAILTNMSFNLGSTRLGKFKKLKQALVAGDYEEAGAQMLDSKWAGQVKGRATRLIERMTSLAPEEEEQQAVEEQPTYSQYRSKAMAAAHSGDKDQAKAILREAKSMGLSPSAEDKESFEVFSRKPLER